MNQENPPKIETKDTKQPIVETKDIDPNLCPNCSTPLNRHGACVRCSNCGYYSCSID